MNTKIVANQAAGLINTKTVANKTAASMNTETSMNTEAIWIEKYFHCPHSPEVSVGIGDDGAVLHL